MTTLRDVADAAENLARRADALGSRIDADNGSEKFPIGSYVRENRQGAPREKVVGHLGNTLELSGGRLMHFTKAVKTEKSGRD